MLLKSKAIRYLKQQEALGLDLGSPEWVSSKPDCACTGSSALGDFVQKEMPIHIHISCSEQNSRAVTPQSHCRMLLLCYCCGDLFRANDMGLNGISSLMLGGTA